MVYDFDYDSLICCFKFNTSRDNIDLKQELIKRYQINDSFNNLLDRLKHRNIKIEDFLNEDNVIETKNEDYKAFICINNNDCKIINDLECIQEVEYIYGKYHKNYNKIDDLDEVLTFKTNHNFIKYMNFDIYSIFDIVNNLNSDNDVIVRPAYLRAVDINQVDNLYDYFICIHINLFEYNDEIYNKCIENKDNKELIKEIKKNLLRDKFDIMYNCYEINFDYEIKID